MSAKSSWIRGWAAPHGEMDEWTARTSRGDGDERHDVVSSVGLLGESEYTQTHRHRHTHTHNKCKFYSE